ncbi:helix-turn-helix domain-containing protein [Sphingomonas sp. BK345]|uniref:AraC family transcriptional regulator n=1 Tax=Sphingomonas sp. BK345 TaxID=2586980 RepID=UPI001608576C|nr:helix-turn-helix domain-containing protein [Sphingomonas sp. BK345]MBB3474888.1 AraC-like DNA-binding protein [Sphingomonas sp. BK345]
MGSFIPRTGTSRDGAPLSLSRTPPDDLAPFVARFFVTIFDRPSDAVLEDFLLHETAYIRVPVIGQWSTMIDGAWRDYEGPMLFGAQQRRFPVRCVGPIVAAGFAIRPAGWFGFSDATADELADRLVPIVPGRWNEALRWACDDVLDQEQTFARLHQVVREHLVVRAVTPDMISARFERIARVDPTRPVTEIAAEFGISGRRLDRAVRQHFGHLPKTVMRRSRFLDMAAVMRGLAVPTADELAELRFYDASHLNREFREFVGMTPAQFRRTPTPLLTPGLEVRQQRKRADLAPHAPAPWLADGQAAPTLVEMPIREMGMPPGGSAVAETQSAARPR